METEKEITLDEVVVKGKKSTPGLLSRIGEFFKGIFAKKDPNVTVQQQSSIKTNKENNMATGVATGAIATSISSVISGVFGFLGKGKELKIEEENTEQLKLQLQAAEDVELQNTLQKKLDIQMTQLNAAAEADRLRRVGSLATTIAVLGLIGLIVVQAFKFKTKKETPQAPIIIQ